MSNAKCISGLFMSILGAMSGKARASELQPFLWFDEPTLEKPGDP